MNTTYPSYGYSAPSPTMAYRPDEVRSMISLARQRIDFHAEQIDVVAEGLSELVKSHEAIIAHYQGLMAADEALIAKLAVYAEGGRMVDPSLPLPSFSAAAAAGQPQVEQEQKQALLQAFSAPGDQKPIQDPNPQFNGRSKREIVESAAPIPQSVVSVVHFEPGEPLPEEALPGHMKREPRSAEALAAEKNRSAEPAPEPAAEPTEPVDGTLTAADIAGA
jgi:hypothetical protein